MERQTEKKRIEQMVSYHKTSSTELWVNETDIYLKYRESGLLKKWEKERYVYR